MLEAISLALQRALMRGVSLVPPVLLEAAFARRVTLDGHRVAADLALLLLLEGAVRGDAAAMSPPEARADFERATQLLGQPLPPGVTARDTRVPAGEHGAQVDIPLRAYTPPSPSGVGLLYMHGGGGVIGSLETHHALCGAIAARTGAVVVSVDYRLGPENRFPAAPDDTVAALRFVRARTGQLGVEAGRWAVGGDSMGGCLATVACLRCRWEGEPQPLLQLLIYPLADATFSTPSHRTFAEGYLLTARTLDWFRRNYVLPESFRDPQVSPLLADSVQGLAPALVFTAGFDPLRDEGRRYADRLQGAGVPVLYRCYDDQVHGFASLGDVAASSARAIDDMLDLLADALARVDKPVAVEHSAGGDAAAGAVSERVS